MRITYSGIAAIMLVRASAASLGHIYALAPNSSTDLPQFVDVDLTTWELTVAPLPGPVHLIGQAATYDNGTFWSAYISGVNFDLGSRVVVGIDVSTHAVAYSLNASGWDSPSPIHVVEDIFVNPYSPQGTCLIVTARALHTDALLFFAVDDPRGTGTARFLGSLNCTYCADMTWDPSGGNLYALYNPAYTDDTSSGLLVTISVANASAPAVVANVSLQGGFAFPQWDATTSSVVGLVLAPSNGGRVPYTRNVTFLADPASGVYNATDHGAVGGGLYVDLQDGPVSFDPISRRAFYMLATGPLAAFDVVVVDVDTAAVLESPSICGFIGSCPNAFAYGAGP